MTAQRVPLGHEKHPLPTTGQGPQSPPRGGPAGTGEGPQAMVGLNGTKVPEGREQHSTKGECLGSARGRAADTKPLPRAASALPNLPASERLIPTLETV